MIRSMICISLLSISLLYGCFTPPEKSGTASAEISGLPIPLLSQNQIEKKIHAMDRFRAESEIDEPDKQIAAEIRQIYQSLGDANDMVLDGVEYRLLIRRLVNVLGHIDEDYFDLRRSDSENLSRNMKVLILRRKEIFHSYLTRDHKAVIDQCIELRSTFGEDILTPTMKLMFALSLGNEGMLEEAINLATDIIPELQESPDMVILQAQMTNWQLQLGRRERALKSYEKLTDIIDDRKIMATDVGKRIYEIPQWEMKKWQTAPNHAGLSDLDEEATRLPENIAGILAEVDRLLSENRFEEARQALLAALETNASVHERRMIENALLKLDRAEERFVEQRISALMPEENPLEEARRLLEDEQYEEAISRLESLEEAPQQTSETLRLKKQAIHMHINRERNRAAKNFLAAKKTRDMNKKRQYLRKSYYILKSLIDKYPSSKEINKVKSNMKTVVEEMDRLGIELS